MSGGPAQPMEDDAEAEAAEQEAESAAAAARRRRQRRAKCGIPISRHGERAASASRLRSSQREQSKDHKCNQVRAARIRIQMTQVHDSLLQGSSPLSGILHVYLCTVSSNDVCVPYSDIELFIDVLSIARSRLSTGPAARYRLYGTVLTVETRLSSGIGRTAVVFLFNP